MLTIRRVYCLELFPFQNKQTLQQFALASVRLSLQLLFKSRDVFRSYPMCLMITLPHDGLHVVEGERLTRLAGSRVSQSGPMSDNRHW